MIFNLWNGESVEETKQVKLRTMVIVMNVNGRIGVASGAPETIEDCGVYVHVDDIKLFLAVYPEMASDD